MNRIVDFIQQNKRVYLILGALVVLNVVLFFLGAYREISLYRDSADVLRRTEKEVRETRRNRDTAREIAGTVRQVQSRMNKFFSEDLKDSGSALPDLTRRLYEILTANRMEFQNVTYSRKSELKGQVNRVTIHVPVTARYADLRQLIAQLEGLPFPVMVDRISVSSASGLNVNATIDIVTYYREP